MEDHMKCILSSTAMHKIVSANRNNCSKLDENNFSEEFTTTSVYAKKISYDNVGRGDQVKENVSIGIACNSSNLKKYINGDSCDSTFIENTLDEDETSDFMAAEKPRGSGSTNAKLFSCSTCGKEFKRETCLIKHTWLHTGEQPFTCAVCKKRFSEKGNLKIHMRIHTGEKSYVCNVCGKEFTRMSTVLDHIRIHTGEKPYQCDICNKSFSTTSGLNKHKITHSTEKPFACKVCGNCYSRKGTLDIHMVVHTRERPHERQECGKAFTQKDKLTSHMKEHRFKCEECGKTFVHKCQLKKHVQIHRRVLPYQCGICSKKFLHRTRLIEHTELHRKERLYTCNVCGKQCKSKSSVTVHMSVHSLEKPHECNECGKIVSLKDDLKHDLKIHSGVKACICETCGQECFSENRLNHHSRIHSGEKDYICKICGKGYSLIPSFIQHMKRHTTKIIDKNKDSLSSTEKKFFPHEQNASINSEFVECGPTGNSEENGECGDDKVNKSFETDQVMSFDSHHTMQDHHSHNSDCVVDIEFVECGPTGNSEENGECGDDKVNKSFETDHVMSFDSHHTMQDHHSHNSDYVVDIEFVECGPTGNSDENGECGDDKVNKSFETVHVMSFDSHHTMQDHRSHNSDYVDNVDGIENKSHSCISQETRTVSWLRESNLKHNENSKLYENIYSPIKQEIMEDVEVKEEIITWEEQYQ